MGREQLVKRHEEVRTMLRRQVFSGHTTSMSFETDVKPPSGVPAKLARCTPIRVADMSLGTVHRRRVLRGRLLVDPAVMSAVQMILEDEAGDVVVVSLYNALTHEGDALSQGGGTHDRQRWMEAENNFGKGRAIAVMEPFYKKASDGTLCVRVEDPTELVLLESLDTAGGEGGDPATLQAEGNTHFRRQEYREAEACYDRALRCLNSGGGGTTASGAERPGGPQTSTAQPSSSPSPSLSAAPAAAPPSSAAASAAAVGKGVLTALLNNASACRLKLGSAPAALQLAAAALVVDPRSEKGHLRANAAIDELLRAQKEDQRQAGGVLGSGNGGSSDGSSGGRAGGSGGAGGVASSALPEDLPYGLDVEGVCSQHCLQQPRRPRVPPPLLAALLPPLLPPAAAAAAMGGHSRRSGSGGGVPPAGQPDDPSAAARHKEEGNALFAQGMHAAALERYEAGLSRVARAAALLANRAACRARLGQPEGVVLDALAALAVMPGYGPKAHYRVAGALLELRRLDNARAVLAEGLRTAPNDDALLGLKQRLDTAAAAQQRQQQREEACTTKGEGKASNEGEGPAGGGSGGGSGGGGSGGSQREISEQELSRMRKDGTAGAEDLRGMLAMLEIMPGGLKGAVARALGPNVVWPDVSPKLLYELQADPRGWPTGIDVAAAEQYVVESQANAAMLFVAAAGYLEGNDPNPGEVMQRLGSVSPQVFEWYTRAPEGDIRFHPRQPYPHRQVCHSYGNAPPVALPLAPGEVHAGIGFTDLGPLAEAVRLAGGVGGGMRHERDTDGGSSTPPPARWVGFEASEVAVAKSMVLLRMMIGGAASVGEILQVWYSAAWSRKALESFRSAVTSLLEADAAISSPSSSPPPLPPAADVAGAEGPAHHHQQQQRWKQLQQPLDPKVARVLQHWQLASVPLAAARRGWLELRGNNGVFICNFTRARDRVAVVRYMLTGQMGGGAAVGSVTMFAVPQDLGKQSMGETCLQTIDPGALAAEWRASIAKQGGGSRGREGGGVGGGGDVMQAADALLRERITQLSDALTADALEVELHMCALTPGDTSAQAKVRSLSPDCIVWSNLPDYVDPQAFHRMARACSGPRTRHAMAFCNYPRDVRGACSMDYCGGSGLPGGRAKREQLLRKGQQRAAECYREAGLAAGTAAAAGGGSSSGGGRRGRGRQHEHQPQQAAAGVEQEALLVEPPLDNALSIMDYELFHKHSRRWVAAFLAARGGPASSKAEAQRMVEEGGNASRPQYTPWARSSADVRVQYSYP